MKEILGLKRILILSVLGAIAAAQAGMLYFYFIDRNNELKGDIRKTTRAVSKLNNETDSLRNDYELINEQQAFVAKLEQADFISRQNRLEARDRIAEVQQMTDILSASYSIASAQEIETPAMMEVNHVVLSSRVTFDVTATNDIAIYQFAYWIENSFPGHMVLTGVSLEREHVIDNNILRTIALRGRMPLVKGSLNYLWRTVAPVEKDDLEKTLEGLGLGGGL